LGTADAAAGVAVVADTGSVVDQQLKKN